MQPKDAPSAPRPAADPHPDYVRKAREDHRLLRSLLIVSLALGCAGCFAFNLVDPDLWGHVFYGQEWLAEGELPRTATHTFTAPDHPWVNHENLAELAFAKGFETLGVRGMLLAKCAWGMAIVGLMYWVSRWRRVPPLTVWALLLLVAVNLKPFFPMRPQLLSFMCCAALLTLLEASFLRWRRPFVRDAPADLDARREIDWRVLPLAPLVIVAWVNSHGGFAAGLCIALAYLFGRLMEMIIDRRRGDAAQAAGLIAVAAGCLLAVFANPYGPGLVQWLAQSIGAPRPEITEWAAPKPSDPLFWQFIALVAVNAIAWSFTKQRRDWVKIVIIALVAWQAASHLRHIAFLALLTGFWTPPHAHSVISRLRRQAAEGLPIVRPSPLVKWGGVAAIGLALVVQSLSLGGKLATLPVERGKYPVDAIQFMADRGLSGRLVVCFNWAQYALAALAPETTVSFDGRFRTCYPQEVVDMNFDFLIGEYGGRRHRSPDSGPIDGARVLEYGDPELVLVDRQYDHATRVMQEHSVASGGRWTLLYQDGVAQLWGRTDLYDRPGSPRRLAPEERVIGDRLVESQIQWPALPDRRRVRTTPASYRKRSAPDAHSPDSTPRPPRIESEDPRP